MGASPVAQAGWSRRLGNALLNAIAGFLAGRPSRSHLDVSSARREVLVEFLHLMPDGFSTPTIANRSRRSAAKDAASDGAGDRADLQRAHQPAGARGRVDAAPERAGAGRRRSVARRHRRRRRCAGPHASRPDRGHASDRKAEGWAARTSTASSEAIDEPVDVICQMDADLSHDPKHLPDLIAAAPAGRRRDRIALHSGRRDRELAEAAAAAQPIRQHLHPCGDAIARPRLHQRLSLLASRGARRACRSIGSSPTATRSWSRCCSSRRAAAAASPRCRSRSSSGAKASPRFRAPCCSSRR